VDDFEEAFQRAKAREEQETAASGTARAELLSLEQVIRAITDPYFDALAPLVRAKLIALDVAPVKVRQGVRYWNLGNGIWDGSGWNGISSTNLALSWDGVFISTYGSGGIVASEAAGRQALLSRAFFFDAQDSLSRYMFQGPLCVEQGTSRVCVLVESAGADEGYRARGFADYVGEQVHYLERSQGRGRQGT
jgi:hypothetical protein